MVQLPRASSFIGPRSGTGIRLTAELATLTLKMRCQSPVNPLWPQDVLACSGLIDAYYACAQQAGVQAQS